MMDLIGSGVAFAGFGLMYFFGAKGDALKIVAKAKANAIRRKADHEFGKDFQEMIVEADKKFYRPSSRGLSGVL